MKNFVFLAIMMGMFVSCSKDEISIEEQFIIDKKIIEDYLVSKNLKAEMTPDGVYFIREKEGSAEKPKITSTVTVGYKGYFLDGETFDSSTRAIFPLYTVVEGWQIGIPKFGRGGKGVLLIPSKYGYGTEEVSGRKSAVLAFDIEVLDF